MIPAAVEESLRFEPPVLFLFRTVTEDTEIADRVLPDGERVVMGIASANRDETVLRRRRPISDQRRPTPSIWPSAPVPIFALATTWPGWRVGWSWRSTSTASAPGSWQLTPEYEYELMPHFLEYGPERLDVVVDR